MAASQEGVTDTDTAEMCLRLLEQEGDATTFQTALTTMNRILRNVQENPTEEKYRKIRKENAAFKNKVWRFEGAQQFLFAIGFIDVGDEVILPDDSQLQIGLSSIGNLLDSSVTTHQNNTSKTSPEKTKELSEKDKQLAEERQKQLREFQRQKEEKKRINEMIKADRRDTSTRENKNSHGRQLNFGAQKKTFKDVGVDVNRGGG